ncbi:hypothetical protein FRX31_007603 [Thalictrum thalictroides]|uniref:Uncharacterized protein n=1 Tax=Thalictrum thalictroides TaxID=46969 RepID=A0A7J6X1Z5_THATH|nr:hypothetical protein FRX31_007603 [Thalictrum thalictroides]
MGSYAPLDNEMRDGVMDEEIGINSDFSETSLFAKTEEDSVLEQFSFTNLDNRFVQDQSIVEQGLGLVTDCTLASEVKYDVFNISGSQHDDDVGSLTDYVKTPILSSSPSTQPSESIELDNYNITENVIGPLEETAKDILRAHEENQDLSPGDHLGVHGELSSVVETDLITQIQQLADCHAVDPLEETIKDHLGVHEIKQELSSGVEIDLMSKAKQIEKSPCVLERDGLSGGSSASPKTKGNEKPELISRSTYSDIIISVPRRSTCQNRWCQNSKGGKISAQREKAGNKKLQCEFFLNTVIRKRSSCKRARSSLWGSLENIIQVKENEATRKDFNHSIQVENQSSHERRDVPENGRWQKTHADSLLAAKGKQYALNEKTSDSTKYRYRSIY